jgi:hypothetical protein
MDADHDDSHREHEEHEDWPFSHSPLLLFADRFVNLTGLQLPHPERTGHRFLSRRKR